MNGHPPTPIAVALSGGPFCGARGLVALQSRDQPVYLIRDQATRQVHAYEAQPRCEIEDGVPVGWVLQYLYPVGQLANPQPGIPEIDLITDHCSLGTSPDEGGIR